MSRRAAVADPEGLAREKHRRRRCPRRCWCVLLLASLLLAARVSSEPLEAHAYSVKAGYLLNFTRFITWPPTSHASPSSPIRLCVVGSNSFDGRLERAVRDRSVRGHPLLIQLNPSPDGDAHCHVLFVSRSEKQNASEILQQWQRPGVLTVGDFPSFVEAGGAIELIEMDAVVRFKINLQATQRSQLLISAQLLEIAQSVSGIPETRP